MSLWKEIKIGVIIIRSGAHEFHHFLALEFKSKLDAYCLLEKSRRSIVLIWSCLCFLFLFYPKSFQAATPTSAPL